MKKNMLSITLLLLLVGCSNSNKKLTELENENASLKQANQELVTQLNEIKDIDYTNKYKNGYFDCHNTYGGVQRIRFLSASVLYITGVDEDKLPMFNNYYVYKYTSQNKITMIDDIDLPDSLNLYTYEFLMSSTNYLEELTFTDDGKELVFDPKYQIGNCTYSEK